MNEVESYARDVVAGRVPAGKYHRLACARHLRDIAREGTPEFPYRFDLPKAERIWRFAENLKHYKGEWAGQCIKLEPHQKFRKGCKYGWVHVSTGLRRFRNAYEEIPRKNGKTLDLATETLYLTFFDGEGGAEGYCAATKREQALIIFEDCKKLVNKSALKKHLVVQVSNIHDERTASRLQPLSADYNTMDGLNVHTYTLDEMHALKSRGTVDVLETATGARRQPMGNKITTAGEDPVSPCGDEHDYATKILDGVIVDETYFAFIAHADIEDDWTLPETAAKANPNYGVSVKPDDLMSKVVKAKGIPKAAATYQQKHLNIWVNTSEPCLDLQGWRKGQRTWSVEDMKHEPCFVGVDLASKLDLMALVFLFPPTAGRGWWRILPYVWTPEETLIDRSRRDRAPYDTWVDQGAMHTTPGPVLDHSVIRDVLTQHRADFDIERIGFDPWHADKLIDELVKVDGWDEQQVLAVPQTYQSLSSAEAKFQAEVMAGNIDAGGNPVVAWCAANVVNVPDGKNNILFSKKKSRGRIDPIKAATTAMSLALRMPIQQEGVMAEWL